MAVIPYFPFGSGAGFQLFTQSNNLPGIYANAAARDTYFTANPTDLARLDADEFLIIKLEDDGNGDVAYQQRSNSTWVDVTSLVQGETGPAGATGNSYFFPSVTERDTFFNTGTNKQLLEKDLPVVAGNSDANITTTYTWTGDTNPTSYDPDLFVAATIESGTNSFRLGSAQQMSSAGQNVGFTNLSDDVNYHPLWQTYAAGNTGTNRVRTTISPTTVSDKTANLSAPEWVTTVTVDQTLTSFTLDFVNAVTSLTATVTKGGNEYYKGVFGAVSTGEQTITLSPPVDLKLGEVLTFKLTDGTAGNVTVKGNATTGIPYQVLNLLTWEDKPVATGPSTTVDNHLVTFNGTSDTDLQVSEDAVLQSSGTSGTPSLDIQDSSGNSKLTFSHNDSADTNAIDSTVDLTVTTSDSSNQAYSSAGTIGMGAATGITVSTTSGFARLRSTNGNVQILAPSGIYSISSSTAIAHDFTTTRGDTVSIISLFQSGSNGASSSITVGNRSPEGNVSKPTGGIYIKNDFTTPDIFLKQSGSGSTGWRAIFESIDSKGDGDVTSSESSSIDNHVVTFDGTTGKIVEQSGRAVIRSENSVGLAELILQDSSANNVLLIEHFDSLNRNAINSPVPMVIEVTGTNQDLTLESTTGDINNAAGGQITFTTSTAGTSFGYSFAQSGTGGGSSSFGFKSTTPEGSVTGSVGDVVFSESPDIYLKRTGSSTTGWEGVFESIDAIDDKVTASSSVASMSKEGDLRVSQTVTSGNWTTLTAFDTDVISTTGALTSNQANNRINILSVDDTTNGDLYEVNVCMSNSAQTNTDIDYRIAVIANSVVQSNPIFLRNIHNDGSNFVNAISLGGIVRGPTSLTGGVTIEVQFKRTTGTTNYTHYCESARLSVKRIS